MEKRIVSNDSFVEFSFKLLQTGTAVTLVVKGNSMYPFLHDNIDSVTLKALNSEDLKPGRIVLFCYHDKFLLHRIIKIEETNYYLRGDNNWSFHLETCKKEDIQGVVIRVRRNGYGISCDSWWWRFLSLLWIRTHKCRVHMYAFYRYFNRNN